MVALTSCPDALAQAAVTSSPSAIQTALDELEHSSYSAAERDLLAATKGPDGHAAWLGLARLYLVTGRYAESVGAADKAAQGKGQTRLDAAAVKAQALAAQGRVSDAIAVVEKVKDDADARRARLVLGELLIRVGRRADARDPLMAIIQDYNNDAIRTNDSEGLALVGRAAHLLRSARDANDAFNQSEHAGSPRVETLLWRADLFLEKYDPGHAEEVVRDALKIAPNHPDAQVMLARIKLEQALDFDAAEAAIAKALATNPKHAGAFAVRAGLALRDFDLSAAEAAIGEGLRSSPGDLGLLSTRAAARLLADDRAGFDAAIKQVLSLNAQYSSLYQTVNEFAEWEHRYDEIIGLMREAVNVDPRDGKAWAVLGLNLVRVGDDTPGLDALRKAWSFDKFNVRVYNTLNLYEKEIPAKYVSVDAGHFRFRYDKSERAVLERYVPPMLEEAYASMVARYGMTPVAPIGIELYSDPEHFSVRTSGLPHVGIQGVCFGRTLAAASPLAEPFNWGNVLWHELGHVFAIQLSKAHVPRWFTEGLSEYETFLRRPEWQREEDLALFGALNAKRIPKVAHFNRAFTHADSPEDVTMAYYAASQIVTYVGQRFGMPKIVEMLRLWGQGVRDPEVVKRALGIDMEELDRQFRGWLEPRMARYRTQFVADLHAPSLEDAVKAANGSPGDVRKQVEVVIAALRKGDADLVRATLQQATKLGPTDPHVRYLTAKLQLQNKDTAGGKRTLESMIRDGQDGYGVRMQLADLAERAQDRKTMRAHLEAARRLDPTQLEPLQALHDLAMKEKRAGDRIATLRELTVLDQHNRKAYQQLIQLLAEAGQWEELRRVGARAVFVDVHSATVHRLYGEALAKGGERDKAVFELESALLCNPPDKDSFAIHVGLARLHREAGKIDKARSEAAEALKIDPGNVEARALAR